jgi:hypothetical protein
LEIGVLGFDSRRGLVIFVFTTVSRTALGVKRSGLEADHSPSSSAEVKNAWGYISTPQIRLHGMVYRETFTFTHVRDTPVFHVVLSLELQATVLELYMEYQFPISPYCYILYTRITKF